MWSYQCLAQRHPLSHTALALTHQVRIKKQQLANKTFRNLGLLCELVFLVLYCSVGDENVY